MTEFKERGGPRIVSFHRKERWAIIAFQLQRDSDVEVPAGESSVAENISVEVAVSISETESFDRLIERAQQKARSALQSASEWQS